MANYSLFIVKRAIIRLLIWSKMGRSVKENKSEFKVAVDYIKPDIICGTESWLKGYKPGKTPTSDAIKTSEIFPDNHNVFFGMIEVP